MNLSRGLSYELRTYNTNNFPQVQSKNVLLVLLVICNYSLFIYLFFNRNTIDNTMMEVAKPPKPLILEGNLSKRWKSWKKNFALFMQATLMHDKPNNTKTNVLLHCIGKSGRDIYNSFDLAADEKTRYDLVLKKFDEYFSGRKNLTFLRYQFLTARQNEDESFDDYCSRVRRLSIDCEFDILQDSMIKDLIIVGIRDKRLQERFLKDDDINLKTVIKRGRVYEATVLKSKSYINDFNVIKNGNDSDIELRTIIQQSTVTQTTKSLRPLIDELRQPQDRVNIVDCADLMGRCTFCDKYHPKGSCPACNRVCYSCNQKGHYLKCCPEVKADSKVFGNIKSNYNVKLKSIFKGLIHYGKIGKISRLNTIDGVRNGQTTKVKIENGQMIKVNKMENGQMAKVNKMENGQMAKINKMENGKMAKVNKMENGQMAKVNKMENGQMAKVNKMENGQMAKVNKMENGQMIKVNKMENGQMANNINGINNIDERNQTQIVSYMNGLISPQKRNKSPNDKNAGRRLSVEDVATKTRKVKELDELFIFNMAEINKNSKCKSGKNVFCDKTGNDVTIENDYTLDEWIVELESDEGNTHYKFYSVI